MAFTNYILLASDSIIFVYQTHTFVVVLHQLFFEDCFTIPVQFRVCHRLWGVKRWQEKVVNFIVEAHTKNVILSNI